MLRPKPRSRLDHEQVGVLSRGLESLGGKSGRFLRTPEKTPTSTKNQRLGLFRGSHRIEVAPFGPKRVQPFAMVRTPKRIKKELGSSELAKLPSKRACELWGAGSLRAQEDATGAALKIDAFPLAEPLQIKDKNSPTYPHYG